MHSAGEDNMRSRQKFTAQMLCHQETALYPKSANSQKNAVADCCCRDSNGPDIAQEYGAGVTALLSATLGMHCVMPEESSTMQGKL